MARLNPHLLVKQVATGVHVYGGGTVVWGLVYLNGEPPSKTKVETALREAGFDFVHNVLTQAAYVWTDHAQDGKTSDAYREGGHAYWEGVVVSDSPYNEATDERRSWEEGWRAAWRHDYDEGGRNP